MLATGRHTVAFSAYDCNGNFASKTVDFQVIGSYGIDRIGNYPNPFDEETVFTYRLTGPTHAREISLKIYTVSGRLVKSFHDFVDDFGRPGTQLDYHVKTWDGRDKEGNRLANGVYFYKIRAKWESQTVHKTGKLAILK
jgi:flagellar hook assembly protein FlgD